MLLIFTAGHAEAEPFIARYRLKKRLSSHIFPIFRRDGITLCETGQGAANAAAAVGYVFGSLADVKRGSVCLLYTGICATAYGGGVIYPHTITDGKAGVTLYPDMLYEHPFTETQLDDAESAALFQAASRFLPPHRIFVVKAAADDLTAARDAAEAVMPWIEKIYARIVNENTDDE